MKNAMRVLAYLAVIVCATASAATEPLAPVNLYAGTQWREDVFEFTAKPAVKKAGGKWIVTFASKANCDATVAVLDKDGKIIRHLASGVLGKNAPHPFQQNSLSQKIAWDGKNDQGESVSAETLKACKVRVSLGLRCEFEKNIIYDPYEFAVSAAEKRRKGRMGGYLVGQGPNDEVYVLGIESGRYHGRVFKKDGAYVRTFWPPSAKDTVKLTQFGFKTVNTDWGDSVLEIARRGGITPYAKKGRTKNDTLVDAGKIPFALAGISDYKEAPRPEWLPAPTLPKKWVDMFNRGRIRMAADRMREKIYICQLQSGLYRIDGATGQVDPAWFPKGDLDNITEVFVGSKGRVYLGVGSMGYNQFIVRLDYGGGVVDFGGDAVPFPKKTWESGNGQFGKYEGMKTSWNTRPKALRGKDIKALWTGLVRHSNTHERGLYVSPRGFIVAAIQHPVSGRAVKYGAPKDRAKIRGRTDRMDTSYIAVWNRDGEFLTANAVGDMENGHGVAMDGDGNIYAVMGAAFPKSVKTLVGLVEGLPGGSPLWGGYGSLLKFRGGVPFPRARSYHRKSKYNPLGEEAPADAFKVKGGQVTGVKGVDDSLLWAYPGVICQTFGSCTCHHLRYDMDYFARHWIPANYLGSVIVIDANANIVARIGRYGNVDDADSACGKIHVAWPRALCVSDTALYVADPPARRVFKAAITYAVEETVALK